MNDRLPQHPDDPTAAKLARIEQLLADMRAEQCRGNAPAQLHAITFEGAAKKYIRRSEHPPAALSIGIVNPVELSIYVGLSGERAAPNSRAFVVPPKSAMVVPVAVDKFELGVDPTVLGEESATIFLLRFDTVQPFFLGSM
ncbi:MAG TPA: hypothetical protein VFI17_03540 [Solirubrobacterales bacterium]|nr:hypothetical protein [Solirubrobacterales bacterium]